MQNEPKIKLTEERKKYEFDTWILSLPPINLYNVELVYLAFGYDQRWELKKGNNERLEIY